MNRNLPITLWPIPAKARCTSSTTEKKGHKKEEIAGKKFNLKDTYQVGNAHPPGPDLAVGRAEGNVLHLLGTTGVGRHARKRKSMRKNKNYFWAKNAAARDKFLTYFS